MRIKCLDGRILKDRFRSFKISKTKIDLITISMLPLNLMSKQMATEKKKHLKPIFWDSLFARLGLFFRYLKELFQSLTCGIVV